MRNPIPHNRFTEHGKYNYLFFDSVTAFNTFVNNETEILSASNRIIWSSVNQYAQKSINSRSDWFGTPTPKTLHELQNHDVFLGMSLVKNIQPKIKDQLYQYLDLLQDAELPKPKLAYNDRGLGVFSFERAAMAMYKSYTVSTSSPIMKTVSQMHIELGNHQIQTSVKSVYAYFKDKQLSYPAIQLYVQAGANVNIKGDQLLYVGLACAELVDFMELRGISVEVNVLLGTSFDNQTVMGVIRIKQFQDPLDKNQLLLMSSDPRYFRYRGFKALVAISNYFDLTIPEGLGRITSAMGNHFVQTINPEGFVFEQSYTMNAAVKEVSKIIKNYKKQITS